MCACDFLSQITTKAFNEPSIAVYSLFKGPMLHTTGRWIATERAARAIYMLATVRQPGTFSGGPP